MSDDFNITKHVYPNYYYDYLKVSTNSIGIDTLWDHCNTELGNISQKHLGCSFLVSFGDLNYYRVFQ